MDLQVKPEQVHDYIKVLRDVVNNLIRCGCTGNFSTLYPLAWAMAF